LLHRITFSAASLPRFYSVPAVRCLPAAATCALLRATAMHFASPAHRYFSVSLPYTPVYLPSPHTHVAFSTFCSHLYYYLHPARITLFVALRVLIFTGCRLVRAPHRTNLPYVCTRTGTCDCAGGFHSPLLCSASFALDGHACRRTGERRSFTTFRLALLCL